MEKEQKNKIKEIVTEFFGKMTLVVSDITISDSSIENKFSKNTGNSDEIEVIDLDIKIDEPQILIGQQGQTLFEIQRILRAVLTKNLNKTVYLNLDIDGYKKKKIDYLKYLVKDYADQVSFSSKEKELPPMSAYERRIIHAELSQRIDVITESRGEDADRHIVIKPK